MALDESEVRAAAALARLALSDEEVERFRGELEAFFAHVRDLDSVDLEGVPPTLAPLAAGPRLREDVPRPGLPRDEAQAAAPAHDGERFVMPSAVGTGAPDVEASRGEP